MTSDKWAMRRRLSVQRKAAVKAATQATDSRPVLVVRITVAMVALAAAVELRRVRLVQVLAAKVTTVVLVLRRQILQAAVVVVRAVLARPVLEPLAGLVGRQALTTTRVARLVIRVVAVAVVQERVVRLEQTVVMVQHLEPRRRVLLIVAAVAVVLVAQVAQAVMAAQVA
jgi:hypothetical protein